MNNVFCLLSACTILAVTACKKEENEDPATTNYEFIDQPLQGKINGESWTFVDGSAEEHGNYSVIMYEATYPNPCSSFSDAPNTSTVGFVRDDLQPGTYQLNMDQYMLIFDKEEGVNYLCTDGVYEILSIDTAAQLLSGRVVIDFDRTTYMNGNFTIPVCF